MKRLLLVLIILLPVAGYARDCLDRTQDAYVEVYELYGVNLRPGQQFALQEILHNLCKERPASVVRESGVTRYRTTSPKRPSQARDQADVVPAWVEIDWYRGISEYDEPVFDSDVSISK